MDNIRGYNKRDAGYKGAEHRLSGPNGHPALGHQVYQLADQQLDKRDEESRRELEQSVPEQTGGVLLRENLAPAYVGEHTAQKPVGKHDGHCGYGVHEGKPDLNPGINLVPVV